MNSPTNNNWYDIIVTMFVMTEYLKKNKNHFSGGGDIY